MNGPAGGGNRRPPDLGGLRLIMPYYVSHRDAEKPLWFTAAAFLYSGLPWARNRERTRDNFIKAVAPASSIRRWNHRPPDPPHYV